jgi:chaperonin GroES
MKLRPLHDRVVVKRADAETKTSGGIIIPDTAGEKPQQGIVMAAGPGARDETGKLVPLDVKSGDTVLFGKWSGTEVKIDDEDLLIMKESDIMGVLQKGKGCRSPAAPFLFQLAECGTKIDGLFTERGRVAAGCRYNS